VPSSGTSPEELRARLIAAAAEIFGERGFERAGVAAIARRAGVTTGAIYSRWSGKAELLLDAIDANMRAEIERVLSGDGRADTASDVLTELGTHLVEPHADISTLFLEAVVHARRDPEFASMLARRIEDQDLRLAKVVEEGKADGTLDPSLDTEAVVVFSHALGFGFHIYRAIGRPMPERRQWTELIARVVAAGAASGSPTPSAKKGQP
jgi:TetR/AcrR family transcriptional repressor of uid operon